MDTIAEICAGIGLFFIGINALGASLRHSASHWFREKIQEISKKRHYTCAFGLVMGMITQSSSAATFIVINMVVAGIANIKIVLPILIFSSIGTSFLVFVAAFNISLLVFFLLGFVGICYYLKWDSKPSIRIFLDVSFGVCMILLGLYFIENNAQQVSNAPLVLEFLEFTGGSVLLSIVIGVLLTLILQSSAAVTLLVATFTLSGVFTLDQGILLIAGSNLGSGLNIYLLAFNSGGYSKQIAFLQLSVKALGVVGILCLFFTDRLFNLQLLSASLSFFSPRIEMQFAFFYLLMQLIGGLGILLLSKPLALFAAKNFPPSFKESLSKPKFILNASDKGIQSSIDLAFLEQEHLIQKLSTCLSRAEEGMDHAEEIEALLTACENINEQTDQFLVSISHNCIDKESSYQVVNARRCNDIYGNLLGAFEIYIMAIFDNHSQKQFEQAVGSDINAMTSELKLLLSNLSSIICDRSVKPSHKQVKLLTAQTHSATSDLISALDRSNRPLLAHVYSTVNAYNQTKHEISHYANALYLT